MWVNSSFAQQTVSCRPAILPIKNGVGLQASAAGQQPGEKYVPIPIVQRGKLSTDYPRFAGQ